MRARTGENSLSGKAIGEEFRDIGGRRIPRFVRISNGHERLHLVHVQRRIGHFHRQRRQAGGVNTFPVCAPLATSKAAVPRLWPPCAQGLSDLDAAADPDGFIRVRAADIEAARHFLAGNPVYEGGGTVEIRELPVDG